MKRVFYTIGTSFLVWSLIAWRVTAFTTVGGSVIADKTAAINWTVAYTGGVAPSSPGVLMILAVANDNLSAGADGDNGDVTGVTDDAGNTYTKAIQFSNTQAGAAAGANVSIWYCVLANAITTSNSWTVAFAGSVTAKGYCVRAFNKGGSTSVGVEQSGTLANDASDPGSITLSSLTSRSEYLFIRASAYEANSSTVTLDANYSVGGNLTSSAQTSGGGGATNMGIFMEYRINSSPGTSEATNPTVVSADCASAMTALYEYTPSALPHRIINIGKP